MIEVLTVVTVIGILATIGVVSYIGVQKNTRDNQRLNQVTLIAEAIEKYYDKNGEYPDCAKLGTKTNILSTISIDPDVLNTPTGTLLTCTDDESILGIGNDKFIYSYSKDDISKGWKLYYQKEAANDVGVITNRRAVATTTETTTYTLTVLASPANAATITGSGISYADETTVALGDSATPGYSINSGYTFSSWSNCSTATTAVINVTMNGDKTCVANFTINTPDAPTVTASSTSTNTTWSWNNTCPTGSTARYKYRYKVTDSGYLVSDSGWTIPNDPLSTTSPVFTTSTEGYTYTLYVEIQCYDGTINSAWSSDGYGDYYRPVTAVILTVSASPSAAATMSGGGSYTAGTTVTPGYSTKSGYTFSSWSPASCSSSFVISANATCTANFTIDRPNAPIVSASTVSSTTTWSWNNTCPTGSTARYKYYYQYQDTETENPIGHSDWTALTDSFIGFTTSTEGVTYILSVKTLCYIGTIESSWSYITDNSYDRPVTAVTTYTIALGTNLGGSGLLTGGGTYIENSSVYITAGAFAGYRFLSWTGDAGCSGLASHSLTVDSDKSCTANFEQIYTLGVFSNTGGSASGSGTYAANSVVTITATAFSGYSFSNWTGIGCSGAASHSITVNRDNMYCNANFTENVTTTLTAPAAPSVDVDYSQSSSTETTFMRTSSVTCLTGSVEYQYYFSRNAPVTYSSTVRPATYSRYTQSTIDQGYTYTGYFSARCKSGSNYSSWSTGSKSYKRPVSDPGSATFSISHPSPDVARLMATSSCGSGATLYSSHDVYSGTHTWADNKQYGWWADSHSGIWLVSSWGARGNTTNGKTTITQDIVQNGSEVLSTNDEYGIKVNLKCVNTATGEYSSESGSKISGTLYLP